MKKYKVTLTAEERKSLQDMVAAGNRGTIERTRAALEAFYTFLWPPEGDEARKRLLAILDEDLGGKPIDLLYDLAQELGVRASSLVLDAGCGRGNHSVRLAARFGCRVIALDPLDSNLRQVRANVEKEKAAALVFPVGGTFERIPLDSGAVDFIWCRDSLNHARDLGAGFEEMARILKPGGRLLIYCGWRLNCSTPVSWKQPAGYSRLTRAPYQPRRSKGPCRKPACALCCGLRPVKSIRPTANR